MRCIVQMFSGEWDRPSYTADEIIARLDEVTAMLTVDDVIIGWHADGALYRAVGDYLHKKGIAMWLWWPVFAELGDAVPMDAACDLRGRPLNKEGDGFRFCCPSSPRNLQTVCDVFERDYGDLPFDGVFLDRVRSDSFVGGVDGVFSCGCVHCREAYAACGVTLDDVATMLDTLGDGALDVTAMPMNGQAAFSQPLTARFFEAKNAIVTQNVRELCRRFKEKGYKVGLDLFAPLMSRFVGQDYAAIQQDADFIKPMLYRRTEAPAGIGYEYDRLRACAPQATGYPALAVDEDLLASQVIAAKGAAALCPGVEVNYLEGMAPTDPDYIRESVRILRENGADGVTLAWNIMCAPDDHLKAVEQALKTE